MVGRLTLLYGISGLLLGAMVSGALYAGLARELDRQDRRLVASKVRVLEHLVARYPVAGDAVTSEIEHESGEEGPVAFALRVLDANDRVLIETPGMTSRLPPAMFPAPHVGDEDSTACGECVRDASREYLLHASWVPPGGPNATARELQVALNVSTSTQVLADYRALLFVVVGLGVLGTALIGAAVARVAVRPVRDITQQLRTITASQLDARLASDHPWPNELRGLTAEIDQMLDRLEDSFSRLGLFSADLAHALRNPINILRGEAEVALARPRAPEEYQQLIGSSLEEFDRLSRLIDSLLFIARAEDPSRVIERTEFPVRREMDAVREFYDALAAERGVTVRCEGDGSVVGDPTLVRRAVSNLLANALNHTPERGGVSMTARVAPDGGCEVLVRDTGSGISAEHVPRVFDRFYRVEDGQARSTVGAGLGLAIVRSIMRLHGGAVHLESEPGRGTAVRLVFPPRKQNGGARFVAPPPALA
jgi:two-component system heavy metal sensor histidine kinase CusS